MNFGRGNTRNSCKLGDTTLKVTQMERDLGVLVTDNLKAADQVASATAAANSMLWMIRKCFTPLDEQTLPSLYKALVRLRMEYVVQARSPQLNKDINKLEKCKGELLS